MVSCSWPHQPAWPPKARIHITPHRDDRRYTRLTYNRHQYMPPFLKTMANGSLDAPWSVLALLAGFGLLLLGGHWLVQGAVTIARRLGISTMVIGLTIVAFGTSAPELALNVMAAASGDTGLAFGNVVGSNIANIGLVIGLGALVAPLTVSSRIVRTELPWLIIITLLYILLTWLPPGVDGAAGTDRIDGILLLVGAVLISLQWYRLGRRQQGDQLSTESMQDADDAGEPSGSSLGIAWLALIGGILLLIGGGKLAEEGAVAIAMHLGVDEVVVGLTIVAIATTLPEIMTCVIASKRGHADLAIGTVIGSNLFNLVLVMGVTSLVNPVPMPNDGWLALGIMTFFTLLLWPMARSSRSVGRLEGVALLLCYAAAITWTVIRQITDAGSQAT